MSIVFSSDELINVAISIERRGMTFYDIMAKSTDNDMARAIFEVLANMEREHIEIFQNMLGEADMRPPAEVSTDEYADYLQTLVDNAVFTDDMLTSETATQADSDIQALELALNSKIKTPGDRNLAEELDAIGARDIPVVGCGVCAKFRGVTKNMSIEHGKLGGLGALDGYLERCDRFITFGG